jgi:hypothetical protein
MLIPTGGFGWVLGDHQVAETGTSECILNVAAENDAVVDQLLNRVRKAGAAIIAEPGRQPWGYAGTFADPDGHLWMITSGE